MREMTRNCVHMKAVIGFVVALAGCQQRSFNTGQNADVQASTPAPVSVGLDVNDVSLLFPLPALAKDAGKSLVAISTLSDAGKPLVSDALFASILAASAARDVAPGIKVKSGIVFAGKRTETRLGDEQNPDRRTPGPFAFGNRAAWHIVALRFDPCGSRPDRNLLTHPTEAVPTSYVEGRCTPQLRMTAQPIVSFGTDFESSRVPGRVAQAEDARTGDYAMHLIYNLDTTTAKALVAELIAFKSACKGITDHVPLGTHPCLLEESAGRTKDISPAPSERVRALIKKYAQAPKAIAFMGTDLGLDPWIFFTGIIKDDVFVHIPIGAVKVAGVTGDKDAAGKRLPFGNGWFQMMTFVMARKAGVDTVVPLPREGITASAAPFLASGAFDAFNEKTSGETGVERNARIEKMKVVHAVLNRIDDPTLFDPFNTDCVSCHKATGLSRELTSKHSGSDEDQPARLRAASEAPHRFAIPDGITAGLMPLHAQDTRYSVLNFGYFVDRASISRRTANESAFAARMAGEMLGLPSPTDRCEKSRLQDCLASLDAANDWPRLREVMSAEEMTRASALRCLREVCPDKARAKKSFLGDAHLVTFTKNSALGLSAIATAKLTAVERCDVPAGTKALLVRAPKATGKFSELVFLSRAGSCELYGPGATGYVPTDAVAYVKE